MRSDTTITAPGIGASQRAMLIALKRFGEATLGEVETTVHIAPETVRSHMQALVAQGLVTRSGLKRSGPGRPRVCYRLTEAGEALFPQKHKELLQELAEYLTQSGQSALLEAFFEARLKRKRAEAEQRIGAIDQAERLELLARILTEEGFIAEVVTEGGEQQLRICHCPLRDLVKVTRLPCRAEMSFVTTTLGAVTHRHSFIPDGAHACTYTIIPLADHEQSHSKKKSSRRAV